VGLSLPWAWAAHPSADWLIQPWMKQRQTTAWILSLLSTVPILRFRSVRLWLTKKKEKLTTTYRRLFVEQNVHILVRYRRHIANVIVISANHTRAHNQFPTQAYNSRNVSDAVLCSSRRRSLGYFPEGQRSNCERGKKGTENRTITSRRWIIIIVWRIITSPPQQILRNVVRQSLVLKLKNAFGSSLARISWIAVSRTTETFIWRKKVVFVIQDEQSFLMLYGLRHRLYITYLNSQ